MKPAYIHGVGAFSPLAPTWEGTWQALLRGEGAVTDRLPFDAAGMPCAVAAWAPEAREEADPRWALARRAADEAWAEAGAPGGRLGVFVGAESGRSRFATVAALARAAGGGPIFDPAAFGENARPYASQLDAAVLSPAAVASRLAARYGAAGPVETFSLACASGLAAAVEAVRALQAGECDIALAGGVGADADPLMLAGFGKLGALSARGAARPFDLRRDGFVVGEGAAFVVLSREPAAVGVAGVARSLDGFHITQPDPQGGGARRAMAAALAEAGWPALGYVHAHGTGTPHNDAIEAAAIRDALGERWAEVPVSSAKGALGHWVAGAGAVGLLCAVEAARSGWIPPTHGLREPDPACPVRHVYAALQQPVRHALVNAFAFGGANACAVISRFDA